MGTGKTGAANAALLAIQILAIRRPELREKLVAHKERMAAQVEADSNKVRQGL